MVALLVIRDGLYCNPAIFSAVILANRRAKRGEIYWYSGVHFDIFSVLTLQCKMWFGVIRCTCLKMACNSKMAGRIAQLIERTQGYL